MKEDIEGEVNNQFDIKGTLYAIITCMKECLFFCQKNHCIWQSMIFKPTLPANMIEQKPDRVSELESCFDHF